MTAGPRLALVLLLALFPLGSCRLFRKPKPVPKPARLPVQTAPAPVSRTLVEPPPEISLEMEAQIPAGIPQEVQIAMPTPPSARRTPARTSPRTTPPVPEASPPPAAAPLLVPMLTPAQRQQLERQVNERVDRTQGVLATFTGKRLSRDQREIVGQIRTFLKQAEEARGTDLLRANNLAERAAVLAQDLARRLR
jgi:hypothetical protein